MYANFGKIWRLSTSKHERPSFTLSKTFKWRNLESSPFLFQINCHLLQKLVRRLPNFFMEEGHWFVSVYNDDGDEHNVVLVPQNSQVTPSHSFFIRFSCWVNGFGRSWRTSATGIRPRITYSCTLHSMHCIAMIQWFNNSVNFCRSWRRVVLTGATDMGLASLESVSAILDLTEITAARVT